MEKKEAMKKEQITEMGSAITCHASEPAMLKRNQVLLFMQTNQCLKRLLYIEREQRKMSEKSRKKVH